MEDLTITEHSLRTAYMYEPTHPIDIVEESPWHLTRIFRVLVMESVTIQEHDQHVHIWIFGYVNNTEKNPCYDDL